MYSRAIHLLNLALGVRKNEKWAVQKFRKKTSFCWEGEELGSFFQGVDVRGTDGDHALLQGNIQKIDNQ